MKTERTGSRFAKALALLLTVALCLSAVAAAETAGGSISGLLWEDADANGLRAPEEKLLPGITVRLVNQKDGVTVGTVTTDDHGAYRFDGVTRGYYTVTVDAANRVLTIKNAAGGANLDSDFGNGAGEIAVNVRMQRNAAITHLDAGLITPTADTAAAAVGGYVWNDINRNGIWEVGEPAKSGVTLYAVTADGKTMRTTSWWDGSYEFHFASLTGELGSVTVSLSLPANYTLTRYQANGSKNSDFYATKKKTAAIMLQPNVNQLDVDAGLYYREPVIPPPMATAAPTETPPL